MKNILIIILSICSFICLGQEDTIQTSDPWNIPIDEIRLCTPNSNFRTIKNDSIIKGEILEICNSQYNLAGKIVGVIRMKINSNKHDFQILFFENDKIEELKVGESVSLHILPYTPDNKELNKTMELTCTGINGYNLSILKKTGANNN